MNDVLPPDFCPLQLLLQPSGLSFTLGKPTQLVGRHSDADLRLPMADVSRRHCRFEFADGGWRVRDLSSLNGTFLNGERVTEAPVRPGDEVQLGGFTFVVETLAPALRRAG